MDEDNSEDDKVKKKINYDEFVKLAKSSFTKKLNRTKDEYLKLSMIANNYSNGFQLREGVIHLVVKWKQLFDENKVNPKNRELMKDAIIPIDHPREFCDAIRYDMLNI